MKIYRQVSLIFIGLLLIFFWGCNGSDGENKKSNENSSTDTNIVSPKDVEVLSVSSKSILVSWIYPADSTKVTGYRIYRNGGLVFQTNQLEINDSEFLPSTTYCYSVAAVDSMGNESAQSPQICIVTKGLSEVTVTGRLNDTGVKTWSNGDKAHFIVPQGDWPGQDADYGRDVVNNDDRDGTAGFSFSKIGSNGEILPVISANWSAVLDNVTGLMWEVKTSDGKSHDKDNLYTWYEPDNSRNGGHPGYIVNSYCPDGNCDTWHYVNRVNEENFCGYNDWRMPTRMELVSILNLGEASDDALVDDLFFKNTQKGAYWTASPSALNKYDAHYVGFYKTSFFGGDTHRDDKYSLKHIRLVRNNG